MGHRNTTRHTLSLQQCRERAIPTIDRYQRAGIEDEGHAECRRPRVTAVRVVAAGDADRTTVALDLVRFVAAAMSASVISPNSEEPHGRTAHVEVAAEHASAN